MNSLIRRRFCDPQGRRWDSYGIRRQRRIDLLKPNRPDVEKVLIGHAQYRWQAGNGASKLYRYRKQIAYLVLCKDGSRQIMIDIGDESVTPTRKVVRGRRNKKLNKQSAPNAATDVYYYDADGYFEIQVERKTAPGRVLVPKVRSEGRLPDAGRHGGGVGGTDGRHATLAISERALRSAGCADGERLGTSGC